MAIEINSPGSLNSQDSNSSLSSSPERPSHRQRQASQSWKAHAETLPTYSYKDSNAKRSLFYAWDMVQVDGISKRLNHSNKVLGLDLEWKPNRLPGQNNPVALIQLAGQNEVQLHHVHGFAYFPEGLRAVLESPNILKVGVGIENDVKKLEEDWDVQVKHFLDLGPLARTLDPYWQAECPGAGAIALGRLVARYQKKKLDKAQQCSNWENRLTKPQKDYAANDGCAGYDVYQTLMGVHNGSIPLSKFDVPQSTTVNSPAQPSQPQLQQRPSPPINNNLPLHTPEPHPMVPAMNHGKAHQRVPSGFHQPYHQPQPMPHNYNPQFMAQPPHQLLYQAHLLGHPGFRWSPQYELSFNYPPQAPIFNQMNPFVHVPPQMTNVQPFHPNQHVPYHGPGWDVSVYAG